MRVLAHVLRSVCSVAFVLDLVLIFVMMQQQNPYSYDHQQAQSDRFNHYVYSTVHYAFLALAVLLGIVAASSRYLQRLEQQASASVPVTADDQSPLSPNEQVKPPI